MALEDLAQGKNINKSPKGPTGNIPLESIRGAGNNLVPLTSRIIGGAQSVNALGSPTGRHTTSPTNVVKSSPLAKGR